MRTWAPAPRPSSVHVRALYSYVRPMSGGRAQPALDAGRRLASATNLLRVGFVCVSLSCVRRKQDSSLELGNAYSRELLINEHTMPAHPPYMRAAEK